MAIFLSLRKATLVLIFATSATAIISLSAQASDPASGIWELNLEKSSYSPGPPPTSKKRTYEVSGLQDKMISKTIDAKGNQTVHQYLANRDGKDYPFEGWLMADTITLTPVDAFKSTYTMKKAGEVVVTGTREVSGYSYRNSRISARLTTGRWGDGAQHDRGSLMRPKRASSWNMSRSGKLLVLFKQAAATSSGSFF